VEHKELDFILKKKGLYSPGKVSLLLRYVELVYEASFLMNLTGHKNLEEMIQVLLIKSIEPLTNESVPRGTLFADMGTGSGFPGVPLGILFEESRGVLLDSVNKKTEFISRSLKTIGVGNLSAESVRLEDYGHGNSRGAFDLVVSRAMGNPYFCLELGAPLLKEGGKIYLYSNLDQRSLSSGIIDHAAVLGMTEVPGEKYCEFGFEKQGIFFVKEGLTPSEYPRRFARIKREALKFDSK